MPELDPTDGIELKFKFQPAQKRLFHYVSRNGGMYLQLVAPQTLEIGGIRSGKTCGKLLFGIENYCMKFRHCDALILRRTFSELDSGVIQDFKTFVPQELYNFNQTTRIATFKNGSRVVFAGCVREGTLIDTARGLVPIEQVTTADLALTRKGYRRVLWAGLTGVKRTVRIENTWLTESHNVYCDGDFIPAQEILCRKALGKTARLFIRKSSYLKASHIAAIQTQLAYGIATTSPAGVAKNSVLSMLRSGRAFMGQCLGGLKCITKMKIPSIMPRTIWDLSAAVTTGNYTNPTFIHGQYSTALSVGRSSKPNTPISARPAANHAEGFTCLELCQVTQEASLPVPVYDLTVDEEHEYFANGLLVHNCVNNKERDIEKYLGQAYSFILVDECGQFSPDAWELLYSRNTVNAACEPDEHGNFPIPAITGCTNPIGPYWEYYHSMFVLKEPWIREDGMKRGKDGSWWAKAAGEWRLCYDPRNYAHNHTTVLDNEIYIRDRDPGIIARLKALPPAKMKKMLLGLMDRVEGQYFDCWGEEQHVIDLREDPEAIIWQDWQPVWGGQDWGVGHWNAFYLFTKALVRSAIGNDYKLKTVCFKELAPETTGHTNIQFADMIQAVACYPKLPESHSQYERISGKRCKVSAIYFSHEKFSRVMEAHSPADDYSRLLRERGLPPVSRATMDRIGSAGFMYNQLKTGQLVILSTCQGIIMAIPALQRDPDNLDDVLKSDSKADDRYDGFRLGLYGGLAARKTPQIEKDREFAATITDPIAKHFYLRKQAFAQRDATKSFVQQDVPIWTTKI